MHKWVVSQDRVVQGQDKGADGRCSVVLQVGSVDVDHGVCALVGKQVAKGGGKDVRHGMENGRACKWACRG